MQQVGGTGSEVGRHVPSRRAVLLGGLGLALAGCGRPEPGRQPRSVERAVGPPTVGELLSRPRFVVAHRGSGDNWPEHTLTAYANALAAGADAVEISVASTADGVLVCHHDLSARRVLGVDRPIAELTWDEVQGLAVDARRWLGPSTPLEPVSRLEDVLEALGEDTLAFVEDKQGTSTAALLDLLDRQPRARERFVWKQWAGAAQVRAAKARGYAAWGYFDEDQLGRVEEFAETFDVLGVAIGTSDDGIARVVATGLPVMAWEVHLDHDVRRLTDLGVRGLMCSNVPYVLRQAGSTHDAFASGRRQPGDLPADYQRIGWAAQPAIVPERAALRVQRPEPTSYLMGSLADPRRAVSEVTARLLWPDALPAAGGAGLVVGLTSDANGGDGDRGDASGYEVVVLPAGEVQVRAREEGWTGAVLGSAPIPPPRPGQPVEVHVTLGSTVQVRVDGVDVLEVADARWRGGWVRLAKEHASSEAVEFSSVAVVHA